MKYIFTFLIMMGGSHLMYAQGGLNPNREQKIEALYVAFISKELSLTEGEAQKFWPVHAQYDAEMRSINAADELARQQAQLDIKKKYQDRFSKIVGPVRTNTFFIKDGEFRRKLVERLRKLRQQKQGGNRQGLKQKQSEPLF